MFLNCFHCQNSWQIINSSFLVIGTLWGQKEFTLIWRPKSKTTIFKTNSLCDLVRTLWPCLWASWEFINIFRAICIFSATFLGKGWQKPYLWWERSTPLSQAVGERFGCGSPQPRSCRSLRSLTRTQRGKCERREEHSINGNYTEEGEWGMIGFQGILFCHWLQEWVLADSQRLQYTTSVLVINEASCHRGAIFLGKGLWKWQRRDLHIVEQEKQNGPNRKEPLIRCIRDVFLKDNFRRFHYKLLTIKTKTTIHNPYNVKGQKSSSNPHYHSKVRFFFYVLIEVSYAQLHLYDKKYIVK